MYEHSKEKIDEGRLRVKGTAFSNNVTMSAGLLKLGKRSIIFCVTRSENYFSILLSISCFGCNGNRNTWDVRRRLHFSSKLCTCSHCKSNVGILGKHCFCYIPPNFWSPHSIDLNILDFSVLSDLKTRAWKHNPRTQLLLTLLRQHNYYLYNS